MVNPGSTKGKKEFNFDLNLVPMIDVLSACICFLLMTVVWVQVGSMQVNQAMGAADEMQKNPPSVLVYMNRDGTLELSIKDLGRVSPSSKMTLKSVSGKPNWKAFEKLAQKIHGHAPEVKTALIMPHAKSNYNDILLVMDGFRQVGINDVGISPL